MTFRSAINLQGIVLLSVKLADSAKGYFILKKLISVFPCEGERQERQLPTKRMSDGQLALLSFIIARELIIEEGSKGMNITVEISFNNDFAQHPASQASP